MNSETRTLENIDLHEASNQGTISEETNTDEAQSQDSNIILHMGIAEHGKVLALEGQFESALEHYRYAMHLSVQNSHPEVFFRHYLECVIESLELSNNYEEVINYCHKAIELYENTPPPHDMARFDLANIYLRLGVIQMKQGNKEDALNQIKEAKLNVPDGYQLPLADTLLRWLQTNLHIDEKRILQEQYRHNYFSVTKDSVRPEKAIPLPENLKQAKML
ncbi:peptidylprolyl isomerase [Pleionea sediminis]|uniref:peptidylprolyl isomerase n=1 Tax=Pleionea sediminis TaxID=2569479 RepID=UPI0011855886|nr:peptidylprolyl isomerase [Pleionea sediminis]